MTNTEKYISREELLTKIDRQNMNKEFIKVIEDIYISEADKNNMYIVGCKVEGKFIKLPSIALEIINHIETYNSISNISATLGEGIDYPDFVMSLIGLGYIEKYGQYKIIKPNGNSFDENRFGLKMKSKYLNKPYVDIFFNKRSISLFIIVLLSCATIKLIEYFNYNISLLPRVEEFNYIPNLLLLYLMFYISDLVLGLYHETAHVVSARHYGIQNININIGRRLVHLVYQTQIPNTWSVSKKNRQIMYLSGMIADFLLIAILTIIGHFFLLAEYMYIYHVVRIITLILILGILFELKLYMRTDIYYLISDALEQPNLHQDAVKLLKNLKTWYSASKQLRIYTVIMLFSSMIEIIIFIKFIVPFILFSTDNILQAVHRYPNNTLNDYGNLLATILIIGEVLLLIFLFSKEKIQKRASIE